MEAKETNLLRFLNRPMQLTIPIYQRTYSWKRKECETCEHCYGSPVEGPSGQGWDCIIDIECKDASSEFGDEAGSGPGIGQEGYVAPNIVAEAVNGVIKFFKGLFGGEEESLIE
jgi:hypothetical protein